MGRSNNNRARAAPAAGGYRKKQHELGNRATVELRSEAAGTYVPLTRRAEKADAAVKIQGAARSRFAKECVKFLRAKKAAAAFRAYRPRMLTDLHADPGKTGQGGAYHTDVDAQFCVGSAAFAEINANARNADDNFGRGEAGKLDQYDNGDDWKQEVAERAGRARALAEERHHAERSAAHARERQHRAQQDRHRARRAEHAAAAAQAGNPFAQNCQVYGSSDLFDNMREHNAQLTKMKGGPGKRLKADFHPSDGMDNRFNFGSETISQNVINAAANVSPEKRAERAAEAAAAGAGDARGPSFRWNALGGGDVQQDARDFFGIQATQWFKPNTHFSGSEKLKGIYERSKEASQKLGPNRRSMDKLFFFRAREKAAAKIGALWRGRKEREGMDDEMKAWVQRHGGGQAGGEAGSAQQQEQYYRYLQQQQQQRQRQPQQQQRQHVQRGGFVRSDSSSSLSRGAAAAAAASTARKDQAQADVFASLHRSKMARWHPSNANADPITGHAVSPEKNAAVHRRKGPACGGVRDRSSGIFTACGVEEGRHGRQKDGAWHHDHADNVNPITGVARSGARVRPARSARGDDTILPGGPTSLSTGHAKHVKHKHDTAIYGGEGLANRLAVGSEPLARRTLEQRERERNAWEDPSIQLGYKKTDIKKGNDGFDLGSEALLEMRRREKDLELSRGPAAARATRGKPKTDVSAPALAGAERPVVAGSRALHARQNAARDRVRHGGGMGTQGQHVMRGGGAHLKQGFGVGVVPGLGIVDEFDQRRGGVLMPFASDSLARTVAAHEEKKRDAVAAKRGFDYQRQTDIHKPPDGAPEAHDWMPAGAPAGGPGATAPGKHNRPRGRRNRTTVERDAGEDVPEGHCFPLNAGAGAVPGRRRGHGRVHDRMARSGIAECADLRPGDDADKRLVFGSEHVRPRARATSPRAAVYPADLHGGAAPAQKLAYSSQTFNATQETYDTRAVLKTMQVGALNPCRAVFGKDMSMDYERDRPDGWTQAREARRAEDLKQAERDRWRPAMQIEPVPLAPCPFAFCSPALDAKMERAQGRQAARRQVAVDAINATRMALKKATDEGHRAAAKARGLPAHAPASAVVPHLDIAAAVPYGAGGVDTNPGAVGGGGGGGKGGGGGGGGGSFLDTMRTMSTVRSQSTLRSTQRSTARRRQLARAGGRVLRKSASVPPKSRNPIFGGHRDTRHENAVKRKGDVDRRLFGRGGFRGRQVDTRAFTSGFFDDGTTVKKASMQSKLSSNAPF